MDAVTRYYTDNMIQVSKDNIYSLKQGHAWFYTFGAYIIILIYNLRVYQHILLFYIGILINVEKEAYIQISIKKMLIEDE